MEMKNLEQLTHVELLLSNYADLKTLLFVVCWEYMSLEK
jgi:hypothetical protein